MVTNLCYRCGMKGHWSRTCRTPKHLVDIYQESLKKKDKKAVETNFVSKDESVDHDLNDMTHLDVADFFIQPETNIEHLFGDENLQKYNISRLYLCIWVYCYVSHRTTD